MTELKANSTSIEFEKSSQFPQKNSFRHNSQNNEYHSDYFAGIRNVLN